jgi:hypothetical protein
MEVWYRILGAGDMIPAPADIEASLASAGLACEISFSGDDSGWYRAVAALDGKTILELERWTYKEEGIRAELNSLAAFLETCDESGEVHSLMERAIQARQLFTIRPAGDDPGIERACEELSRLLAAVTEGFYQVDGHGFFAADGALLVKAC